MFCFIFCVVFNSFIMTPVIIKNAKLKHALAIPTGTPVPVANDAIEMLLFVADKTIKYLSKQSKVAIYLLSFLLINSLSRISAIK